MPYVSIELLVAAADGLRGASPVTVITIPAILRLSAEEGVVQPARVPFAGEAETALLDMAFKLEPAPNTKTIFRAVWSGQRDWVNADFAGSSLQKQRDSVPAIEALDRFKENNRLKELGLKPDTGGHLQQAYNRTVRTIDLAIWYGRREEVNDLDALLQWFHQHFPAGDSDLIGTLYTDEIPDSYKAIALSPTVAPDAAILAALPLAQPVAADLPTALAPAGEELESEDFSWTLALCKVPLASIDVDSLSAAALTKIKAYNLVFPDVEDLVHRCVTGLILGHLILQGPPGTGKTTLARVLAEVFDATLQETTATGDWSSYHVIGGLRPDREGKLSPVLGAVPEAMLLCAETVRAYEEAVEGERGPQATWLLIDEFNRADIDKAIGSLYTLLSSTSTSHLQKTPLDLWFNASPEARRLWSPKRFRIIGSMNDIDTSFVNPISQGLTRRFQFIVVGVPTAETGLSAEIVAALRQAHDWLEAEYDESVIIKSWDETVDALTPTATALGDIVAELRSPENGEKGWPIGTAQLVDVMRALVLEFHGGSTTSESLTEGLDRAFADQVVPQMGTLQSEQLDAFSALLKGASMARSASAINHLRDTHAAF